jgi:hypothetical protein
MRLDRPEAVPLAIDVAEVAHESRPARESVLARDYELRVGEADACWRGWIDRGMTGAGALEGIWVAGA